jgi:Flp pilus assembly protein TadD
MVFAFTPNPCGKKAPALTGRRAFAKPCGMHASISFVLAAALCCAQPMAAQAANLTDQLFIGAESLARGRFDQAGQAFAQALAQDPQNTYARSRLALALAASGRTDEARAAFEKALAVRGDDLFSLWTLGCLDLLQGQAATAQARFAAMRKADPGNVRATLGLGLAALLSGRLAEAVPLLAEGQAADSQDGLDRFLTGLAYWMLDAPANARLELEATLELEPRNTAALELLGLVYRRQGKANLAKNAWEQALAIDPNQPGARFFLSRLAEDEGLAARLAERPEEARRAYERALAIDPGNEAAAKALGLAALPGATNSPGAPPLDPAGGDNPPRTPLTGQRAVKWSGGDTKAGNMEKKGRGETGKPEAATGPLGH